jgi:hypothetical protein
LRNAIPGAEAGMTPYLEKASQLSYSTATPTFFLVGDLIDLLKNHHFILDATEKEKPVLNTGYLNF